MNFDYEGYELEFIQKQNIKDDSDHLFSYIYRFTSPITKLHYVLKADFHNNCFLSVKFYPKRYRKSDMKYSLITNRGDIGNILITCLNIIPILLNIHPTASFGFAAARTFDKKSKKVEPLRKNQRFKVYAYIAQRKIGDRTFQHFEYPEVSGYLLINRSANHNVESTEIMIKSMLSETYNDLPMP